MKCRAILGSSDVLRESTIEQLVGLRAGAVDRYNRVAACGNTASVIA